MSFVYAEGSRATWRGWVNMRGAWWPFEEDADGNLTSDWVPDDREYPYNAQVRVYESGTSYEYEYVVFDEAMPVAHGMAGTLMDAVSEAETALSAHAGDAILVAYG